MDPVALFIVVLGIALAYTGTQHAFKKEVESLPRKIFLAKANCKDLMIVDKKDSGFTGHSSEIRIVSQSNPDFSILYTRELSFGELNELAHIRLGVGNYVIIERVSRQVIIMSGGYFKLQNPTLDFEVKKDVAHIFSAIERLIVD